MEKRFNGNDVLIISHIDDIDGMGSVVLGNLAFDNVDYVLIDIDEIPKIPEYIKNCDHEEIFICDLALDKTVADEIAKIKRDILVFDHHQTHIGINEYPFAIVEVLWDGKKTCGTDLFYHYLLGNDLIETKEAIAQFVELIRAYDTWDWVADKSNMADELNTLFSVIGTTSFIDTFSESLKNQDKFQFSKEERMIIDLREKEIVSLCEASLKSLIVVNFENLIAGISFIDRFNSRVGNHICNNSKVDFALMIDMVNNTVSMRSTKSVDVGAIALKHGGGGHRHAAGFKLTREKKLLLFELIIDRYKRTEKVN